MIRFILSPAAANDLDQIWDYTAEQWGVEQAERYTDDIRDACIGIAEGTLHVRLVPARSGYFKGLVGSHAIYFRQTDGLIEIVRILHQRMDTDRHL